MPRPSGLDRVPRHSKRMDELVRVPFVDTRDPEFEPDAGALKRAVVAFGVRAEELILFHKGTKAHPGFAVRNRQRLEDAISDRLQRSPRKRFRFASEKEYQWFSVRSHILWLNLGMAKEPVHYQAEENWFRGLELGSRAAYVAEVIAGFEDDHERRRQASKSFRKTVSEDLRRTLALPDHALWTRRKQALQTILFGRLVCDRTWLRWLSLGRTRRSKPGWHLDYVVIPKRVDEPLPAVSLLRPWDRKARGYVEVWKRTGVVSSRQPLKTEYWAIPLEGCGKLSDTKQRGAMTSVRRALESEAFGDLRIKFSTSWPSHLGVGPFPTRDAAKKAKKRLRGRGWLAGDIKERRKPFRDKGFVLLLERPAEMVQQHEWIEQNLSPIGEAIGDLMSRHGELGVLPLGPFWEVQVGPYATPEECKADLLRLRRRGLGTGRVKEGTHDATASYYAPAAREQFRRRHRRD